MTSAAVRYTAFARLYVMTASIWSSHSIMRFWTAGVSRTSYANCCRTTCSVSVSMYRRSTPRLTRRRCSPSMSVWREKRVESAAAQQFWRQALAGSHATSLDSYGAHEPPATAEPDVTVLIPQWLQDAAQHLAASRGLPMKSLLLAAHCVTLQRLSGEADVTTGLVTHGRPGRAGAERAAGLFLNMIPIRLDNSPATWLDVVEHIVRFERASHRYRRYPLQAMQSDAGRPVFNTAFNFVNYHVFAELATVTGVELLGFEADEQTNYALLVTAAMDPRTGRLSLRVTGDRAALTATQAREYANSFIRVLAAIVRSPERASDYAADELAARDVAQFISRAGCGHAGCKRAGDRLRHLDVRRIGRQRRTNRRWPVDRGHAARSTRGRDAGSVAGADRDSARRAEGRCGGCPVGPELPAARGSTR